MASLDDVVTVQKNGVVALNGLRNILQDFLDALVPASGAALKVGYVAVTAAYTILPSDCIVNCTSGTFTVTLPTAVGATGQVYIVKNSGVGAITLDAAGAETIDGALTQALAAGVALRVASTNAGWILI